MGLEEDARGGLERAAEGDQPACLPEVNLGVVRHQRGAGRIEVEASELVEAPDARPAQLLGLIGLDLGLDPLGLFHATSKDRPTGLARHRPSGPFDPGETQLRALRIPCRGLLGRRQSRSPAEMAW